MAQVFHRKWSTRIGKWKKPCNSKRFILPKARLVFTRARRLMKTRRTTLVLVLIVDSGNMVKVSNHAYINWNSESNQDEKSRGIECFVRKSQWSSTTSPSRVVRFRHFCCLLLPDNGLSSRRCRQVMGNVAFLKQIEYWGQWLAVAVEFLRTADREVFDLWRVAVRSDPFVVSVTETTLTKFPGATRVLSRLCTRVQYNNIQSVHDDSSYRTLSLLPLSGSYSNGGGLIELHSKAYRLTPFKL